MNWVKVFSSDAEARAAMKNDSPQLVVIDQTRICLVLHNGKFHAVQDSCTHNGESLSKGKINYLGDIVCPWHGYRFELGTGRACDSSCRDLATYPIKVDEGGFFIGIPSR